MKVWNFSPKNLAPFGFPWNWLANFKCSLFHLFPLTISGIIKLIWKTFSPTFCYAQLTCLLASLYDGSMHVQTIKKDCTWILWLLLSVNPYWRILTSKQIRSNCSLEYTLIVVGCYVCLLSQSGPEWFISSIPVAWPPVSSRYFGGKIQPSLIFLTL